MDRRIAPSVAIEAAIEAALTGGIAGPDQLSELGRLGARLVLQRAVEEELEAFLARIFGDVFTRPRTAGRSLVSRGVRRAW